ncbi:MAG: PcfJ domain-containing protein [Alphaproteobacteria bacterium]|jgi:hypothetical protein|nr:PcfJ domain-containing protein [Alphaproteobacteria bacterium]
MSRNVLNTGDVDRFIEAFAAPCENEAVALWLRRTVRRWILKSYERCGQVVAVERHEAGAKRGFVQVRWPDRPPTRHSSPLPGWLEPSLDDGVDWLDLSGRKAARLGGKIALLLKFLDRPGAGLDVHRLPRLSFPAALALARRAEAVERAAAKADDALMLFPDGYRIVVLDSRREFKKEGSQMRNCAADYWKGRSPGTEVLSLRSPTDRPCVTMEIADGNKLLQIKGRANNPVAPRYRGYIRAFIRALELRIVYDAPWIGYMHRSFDTRDPAAWWHQPWLSEAILLDGVGATLPNSWPFGRFVEDLWASVDTVDDDTMDRLIGLFRAPDGAFSWFLPEEHYEVYGLTVTVAGLGFPWRLLDALREAGRGDRRALRRPIVERSEEALWGFCRARTTALVDAGGLPSHGQLDFSGLRHCRRAALQRRIAAQRRSYRRTRGLRVPEARLEAWETDRRALLEAMEDGARRLI